MRRAVLPLVVHSPTNGESTTNHCLLRDARMRRPSPLASSGAHRRHRHAPGVDVEREDLPISETYDPNAECDGVLTTDELRELSGAVREINPDHVDHVQERVPNGEVVAAVKAAARYSLNLSIATTCRSCARR